MTTRPRGSHAVFWLFMGELADRIIEAAYKLGAAAADETGAAMRIEQVRYERAILDFETGARRRRDAMHATHLANIEAVYGGINSKRQQVIKQDAEPDADTIPDF
jgi:hypothetical protein